MTIQQNFISFLDELQYTHNQREDAKKKYTGVCKSVATHFLGEEYNDNMKFLFGSYKTKTHIRPISEMQDVDVLFKIDGDIYNRYEDCPGQLLQAVRKAIQKTYPTTEKISAWGKVVLVKFADNTHNVEILPGYEQDDGTFLIPNTENGGSWDTFDPRDQIDRFATSNDNSSNLTRELVQMVKSWVKNHTSITYKSFKVVDDVIEFVDLVYPKGREGIDYSRIVAGYFNWLHGNLPSHLQDYSSQVETAIKTIRKAIELEAEGKLSAASDKWRDLFGDLFPKNSSERSEDGETIIITKNPPRPWCHL